MGRSVSENTPGADGGLNGNVNGSLTRPKSVPPSHAPSPSARDDRLRRRNASARVEMAVDLIDRP